MRDWTHLERREEERESERMAREEERDEAQAEGGLIWSVPLLVRR